MKKILVVEDTDAIREEIIDILRFENFDVYEACDGLQGLQQARKIHPDLIVSDILMPQMDGFQMLKELSKDAKCFDIPLIFLSAKAEKNDIRDGMNLGAQDYLIKPLSPNDLIEAIKVKLNRYDMIHSKYENMRVELSKSIPHEMRTPLNGIMGLASAIRDIPDFSKTDVKDIASQIYISSERLMHLIENYIFFTQLMLNGAEYKSKFSQHLPFKTKNPIKNTISILGFKENRIPDIQMMLEDLSISVGQDDLLRIIGEIVDNAIKFSKPGDQIKIRTLSQDESFVCSIYNEGIGMEKKNIEKIEGFTQFDREKNEQQGSGLGLIISKLLTELYGGTFEIDCEQDLFFKVTIKLPM